jgi:hypothetical protein
MVLAASSALALARPADEFPKVENKIHLFLQFSCLGSDGCKVEITPAHRGCSFDPITKVISKDKVAAGSVVQLRDIQIDAFSTGADRDCSFKITVKEPGQEPKVYQRGLQLTAQEDGEPVPEQSFKYYLSTPSIASKDTDGPKRK